MRARWWMLLGLIGCEPATLEVTDHEEPGGWVLPGGLDEAVDEGGVGPVREPGLEFRRLAMRWDADVPVALWVRGRDDGGGWTDWVEVEVTWAEEGMHVGAADLPRPVTAWQLRVEPPEAAEAVAGLEAEPVAEAGAFDERPPAEDEIEPPVPDLGEVMLEPEALAADERGGVELKHARRAPRVVSRRAWGARSPRCGYGRHRPNRITIHHTVTPTHDSMSGAARVRQIQAFHMYGRGWCDIGYHFLIARDGRIYQGRAANRIGGHVANANTGNVGIAFLGNFESGRPSSAQINAAARLIDWLGRSFRIPRDRGHVRGHRQYGGTSCPGRHLYARLDEIVRRARNGGGGGEAQRPREGILRGVVYAGNDTDRRVAGATVRLSDGRTARTGRDGAYRFRVRPGRYSVTVSKRGYERARSETVRVRAGRTRWASVGLRRVRRASTGELVGVVYRHPDSSRRLAGAEVRLSTGQAVRTNAHGVYRVRVRAGDVRITARHRGFRQASVTRTVPRGREVWGSVGLRRR